MCIRDSPKHRSYGWPISCALAGTELSLMGLEHHHSASSACKIACPYFSRAHGLCNRPRRHFEPIRASLIRCTSYAPIAGKTVSFYRAFGEQTGPVQHWRKKCTTVQRRKTLKIYACAKVSCDELYKPKRKGHLG